MLRALAKPRSPRLGRGAWGFAALTAAGVIVTVDEASYASDSNQTHAFVVGRSGALANGAWLDAGNTSRARVHFPRAPEVGFRVRIPGGIGQAPASDAAGDLIVVHAEPRISKLDSRGRTLWSKRLESEVTNAPVLTSSGKIVLVTHDADALLLSPRGKLLQKSPLPLGELRHKTLAISTDNGGVLIANGTSLVELDSAGEVTRQGHSLATVTALAEWRSALLAISDNGSVAVAQATGDFEVIGNLGGTVPDGGAVQDGKIFAVVDEHKLVAFDLTRARAVTLATEPAVALSGPPLLFGNQSSVLVVDSGFLSLRAASGGETLRVAIAESSRAFDPAAQALRPALMIGDADGGVAASRSGSDALILASDGKAQRFESTSCLDPFRPTPTLAGVVFACRSGQLFGISDREP